VMSYRKARRIAAKAHKGQVDKLGVPYIEHVEAVAAGLAAIDDAEDLRIAGVLHDVIEDTHLTASDLHAAGVPSSSVFIVEALTKVPGSTKVQQIERVIEDGAAACLVKLSDNAHNSRPDRLAKLDEATRERLVAKYKGARRMLWDAAVEFNWRSGYFDNIEKILGVVNPSLLPELADYRRKANV
jgi:(p)ppGpp synthase/HD superfamily hydrolase